MLTTTTTTMMMMMMMLVVEVELMMDGPRIKKSAGNNSLMD